MRNLESEWTPEGNNVEILGVRAVDKRPLGAAPSIISGPSIEEIRAAVSESQGQTIQAMAQVANDVASRAVHAALNASQMTVIGTFKAIGVILAVRVLLLLSLVGGFSLAVMAMQSQTNQAIGLLIAYMVLTVLPLVWLDRNGRKKPE